MHLAGAAVRCIICRAGQAPVCWVRLSSNDRHHKQIRCMARLKHPINHVLCFWPRGATRKQNLVRRYFLAWRVANGLPRERCDVPTCTFYTQPTVWNGKPFKLILDHITGNARDNTPLNLRFLCPTCNSQTPTYSGRNKGRIQQFDHGYHERVSLGVQNAYVFPPALEVKASLLPGLVSVEASHPIERGDA